MYTITVLYIITSGFSLFFCNFFFVLFHIYQRKKKFSQKSNSNDDFLLSCIGITIQIGSIHTALRVYSILFAWQNQFLTCLLFNVRVVNVQTQLICMLCFSFTRFTKLFFPQQFSKMNHYLTGVLMKMSIFLGPAYVNFVIGQACGLDIFCPEDFRNSHNLITYTDTLEYQEEMVSLIMENLECRTNLGKVALPTLVAINLILNLFIMAKEVFHILPSLPTVTPSPPEVVELRTVSAIVEHAEASEDDLDLPQNDTDSYSVGMIAGVLTTLIISIGKVLTLMILHNKAGNLMFLMVEMILSILIPLLWLFLNKAIIRARFSEP